jgi:hypothetical protein
MYDDLEEGTKHTLMTTAVSTGNILLQKELLALKTDSKGKQADSTVANLNKELTKLESSSKMPKLKFNEHAIQCRYNYDTRVNKLQPILTVFKETALELPSDVTIPFQDPTCS